MNMNLQSNGDRINSTSSELNRKIRSVFGKLAIDKTRLPMSQLQKRGVPAYVAEWLLDAIVPGEGKLSPEESAKVQKWANKFLPGPADVNAIKNRLYDGEILKVLTSVQVEVVLTRKHKDRVAKLSLLGIKDAFIADTIIQDYPDLLQHGMWGVVELSYTQEGVTINDFRPMQASVNLGLYKKARQQFTLEEWRALMLASMGYNPGAFSENQQLLLLCRLMPLVQKNAHIMELAPKGTGKSYIYENISPRVRLVSGGNVSPAVLFVNNMSGQWGLLARYSVVVLDEVQTLKFEKPQEIIGGLKGFLANGRLTRGGLHETASDCSLVMLANIALDNNQKPVMEPLVHELPIFMQETAFLDRIRGLIPGWEIPKLSGDSFTNGVGLKSDFFGDALLALRNDLEHDQRCARRIQLVGNKIYKRNEDAVKSIASGLLKILFPDGNVTDLQFQHYCVKPAQQLRQLIWNQLQRLDAEYRQYEPSIRYKVLDD
jgi:ATP-dependent Lon protease